MPRVSQYADTEAAERKLLASLPFVGSKQAAYVRDTRNPIATVRSELRRVYATKMADFDQSVLEARVAARAMREPSREPVPTDEDIRAASEILGRDLRTPENAALDAAFGLTEAPTRTTHNSPTLQTFGGRPRSVADDRSDLDRAFLDPNAPLVVVEEGNVQRFGVRKTGQS